MEDGGSSYVPNGIYSSQPSKGIAKKWLLPVVGIAILLLVGLVFFALSSSKKENKNTDTGSEAAAVSFYDALAKGAAQQNIRVAQYRTTYANQADLEAKTDPGFIQSSIAELSNNKFRTVYAQRLYDADKPEFRMGRCIDGVAYIDGLGSAFGSQRPAPKTLPEANEYLKQMYRSTVEGGFVVCPYLGLMPAGSIDLAPARLSDGLMPVTLTEAQASNWKNKLKAANLFTVKDEGTVMHGGKQVRKYSFTPRGDALIVNEKLYEIFYETGEIEKIMREHPDAQWKYEFLSINGANNGGIKGYYLVDETSGLPVFSELKGIQEDKANDRDVARANIGYNKQTYAYPTAPTVELTTPLEILE